MAKLIYSVIESLDARSDIGIGGADLAAEAIRAGLVDEWHLLVAPVAVGGGTPSLPDGRYFTERPV